MSGNSSVPGGSDRLYRERVEIDVNVNVKKNEKTLCRHENHIGECILCERENDSETRKG